ncbi:MAG: amino acid permease [Actinomycetales bacterium]|nr:amino acid permease [Candidatus Phosphoribacter baldrii]HRC18800.1 amino acid permease [Phycicoccus elongatus]
MATTGLHQGLKQRHLTMIAIGGVIGAGLFVGSGVVINEAGPGAFITYALSGVLIIMVMQMLGEMAVAKPSTGSFAEYARDALGPWAGFSVAWLYWYFWVIVVGFEAVAGAKIITYWIDAPLWVLSLILMVLMTATNLYSVKSFGEFEYWFAGIKVATILIFLSIGTLFVLGAWPGAHLDFSNLTEHGGFFPNGPTILLSSIVVVIFSMVGAEIATIAGAESDDPERAVTKATRSVVWRISLFFIGSVFLLAVILPWNSTELGKSPYVSAFEVIGIPYAASIMNAVVLTSVLSCLNSGLYTASRMLFVLAGRREAPPHVLRVNHRGVPTYALLMSTVVGFLCVIAAYISPKGVFSFLLNSSGAVILFAYILIAGSQFVLRRRADAAGVTLKFRMWLFPWLTIASILAMVAVLVSMAVREDTRSQITLGLASWAFLLIVFRLIKGYRERVVDAEKESREPTPVAAHRLLVLANDELEPADLLAQVRLLGSDRYVEAYVVVPKNPIDTGTAEFARAASIRAATIEVAQARLDEMVRTLRHAGVPTEGRLGDFSPAIALEEGVGSFRPDSILVVRNSEDAQMLVPNDVVAQARESLCIPVYSVIGRPGLPTGAHPHLADPVETRPGGGA